MNKSKWMLALALLAGLMAGRGARAAETVPTRVESAQPCWVLGNDQIELAITQLGAQMAPVTFYRNAGGVKPYYISPWQGENLKFDVPVLTPLRGDFFCMPFGGNSKAYEGATFPPHGEMVGAPWTLVGSEKKGTVTALTIAFDTKARPGKVTRQLSLVDGQNVIYSQTRIEGFKGKTSLAFHAILAMPQKERALLVSTSPIKFGMTCPYPFSDPASGEYQSLAVGARFSTLSKVPSIYKGAPDVDCSAFPTQRGFANLLQVFSDPTVKGKPAWVAAVNTEENWLWFALKDPTVLPGRVFWMENHGRYGKPWNGRNNCLGLEDGCSFFDKGIAESCAPNVISRQGIPTCLDLKGDKPFNVNYIEGVVKVPAGFGRVASAQFKPGSVTFVSATDKRVTATVNHEFLWSGIPVR